MDWQAFFAMGGYAAFVWPSYGITAVVLVINLAAPHRRERQLLRSIAHRQRSARGGRR